MRPMPESQSFELTPAQIKTLQRLLASGFQFVPMERITRHVVVEKDGFIALLDPAEGKLKLFGQVGYRVGDGIGMLVEQGRQHSFVWKKQSIPATPVLLSACSRVKKELAEILVDVHQ